MTWQDLEPAPHTLFTLGYSAFFDPQQFLDSLKANAIDALVDVRAFPQIATFEHYREANLRRMLREHGIHYLSFAREFGARPDEDCYYTDDMVDFKKLAASVPFREGCARIRTGLQKYNICLMCAEKDPVVCHRAILICHNLEKMYPEIDIRHILPERTIGQKDVDAELKKRYALLDGSLEACYRLHGRAIAYRREKKKPDG